MVHHERVCRSAGAESGANRPRASTPVPLPESLAGETVSSSPEIRAVRPRIVDVYETVLYGSDIAALVAFYRDVVGLPLIEADLELLAALRLPGGGVLLVFDPVAAAAPGRPAPSHGAAGPGHVAFRVRDLNAWRAYLTGRGIEIERELDWGAERFSIYVRDPAGNSVEFAYGELWE